MKRQSEELIFKYKTNAQKEGNYGILFALPLEYNPIPGDIVEMIISENENYGQVSYYARLVCYQTPITGGYDMHLGILNGTLENKDGEKMDIDQADLTIYGDGYAVQLYSYGSSIPPYVSNKQCNVNIIVHRSKAKIELYYL